MQKGFTLIEMAIVLVIIGLITSLAMKGNDLMDQVTWKRDVQSLEHLQAALLLFRESRGHMPGDENGNGVIEGSENQAAYEELTITGGLEKKDFLFKTGGPYYFSFTECTANASEKGYSVFFNDNQSGTCLFPSELEPWTLHTDTAVDPKITSERTICIFEVGFDDKNVFTGNIRRTIHGSSWGTALNTKMQDMDSALDCFGSNISNEATGRWQDAVIIGLW